VYLPCYIGIGDADAGIAAVTKLAPGTETVLVVEDEQPVRSLTRRILEQAGYRVLEAANPDEAHTLFEEHVDHVSVLVTDIVMPGSSGPMLFERLARLRPDLKVLYVSGYTNDTIAHQGHLHPDVKFLQKPFTADALNRSVRGVLDAVLTSC
jgi:DNA-binding NtrC family response regulator